MYITFDEYVNMGGDSELEETAFENLEAEARAIIDWWTFSRLQKETEYPEAVKRCMFKVITLCDAKQKAMIVDAQDSEGNIQAGIASESNDGVSTSYNTLSAKDAVDTFQKTIESTIYMYLQGVRDSLGHKLLYRGIYPNE